MRSHVVFAMRRPTLVSDDNRSIRCEWACPHGRREQVGLHEYGRYLVVSLSAQSAESQRILSLTVFYSFNTEKIST